jgi:hypothetical protein
MHGLSRSPPGKDTLSWEVRERNPYFYRGAGFRYCDTNVLDLLQFFGFFFFPPPFFSRTPQAHGREKSTRELEGDDLSLFPTIGIPTFRTRVLYVPQRPSLLPGTPRDFLYSVSELKSRRAYKNGDSENEAMNEVFEQAAEVAERWGVHTFLWEREWSNLSGGEAQRIVLAIAFSLDTAEVLLLDGE